MLKTSSSFKAEDWSNWKFHLKNAVKTSEQLQEWIKPTENELRAIAQTTEKYRWMITPYYASLMDKKNERCPIRLQSVPQVSELTPPISSDIDPVGDISNLKTRRIVHKYPNRVVFLVSDTCPVYCRHCTRKYHTTDLSGTYYDKEKPIDYEEDFAYLENHPEIDDVLLTGGDPLILSDAALEAIISRLRAIPHINIIRIGSRFPVFLPQRITDDFCKMLEKYHPFWLNTHFNHPVEITEESAAACDRLLRHGIPVQNQSVLLKGINDDIDTMRQLIKGLLRIRVRPYYIYHCDNVTGVSHFATTLEKGQEIMDALIGFETGFSVPSYVITTKLGKIPVQRQYVKNENGRVKVTNYKKQELDITEYLNTEPSDSL